ncbi:MAG: hypothetical protein KatS3mg092_0450 [Patescibacteria group bacterium]|nr:MAG: hypothetical protein KatS3mg092_0450 [Patescibacteria group bacterium]
MSNFTPLNTKKINKSNNKIKFNLFLFINTLMLFLSIFLGWLIFDKMKSLQSTSSRASENYNNENNFSSLNNENKTIFTPTPTIKIITNTPTLIPTKQPTDIPTNSPTPTEIIIAKINPTSSITNQIYISPTFTLTPVIEILRAGDLKFFWIFFITISIMILGLLL